MLKSVSSYLLYVENLEKTKEFYTKLGFTLDKESDKQVTVRLNWFKIQCFDQAKIEFKRDFNGVEKGAGVFFYVSVDDVDKYYQELLAKGIKPSTEPKNWEWGNREFVVKDPDGYRIVLFKTI